MLVAVSQLSRTYMWIFIKPATIKITKSILGQFDHRFGYSCMVIR